MAQHPPLTDWALDPTTGTQSAFMGMLKPQAGQRPSPKPWVWLHPSGKFAAN